ncbi:MAG: diacylglycerol/lipid kinase family protein [Acidimicrobiales bacterium]
MTIRKGRDWGRPATLPDDGVIVTSDAQARDIVTDARRAQRPVPVLGLVAGDLARSVGATGDEERLRSDQAHEVEVDLGSVLIDGTLHWFVAHLVARHRWWAGRFVVAMNAEYLGSWKMAPRAHPNDGRLDVLDGSLSIDDRLKARARLPRGEHVPHPRIATRQVKALQVSFERPTEVYLDGRRWGRARQLSIRVEPDALRCVV